MAGEVLSMPEAGRRLGIDTAAVFDLVLRRELRFTQTTSGRVQIPVDALEEYLAGAAAGT